MTDRDENEEPWDVPGPETPDKFLPDLTCSLRLDFDGNFRHGFAVVDFRDASGYLLQTVTIDLISGEIRSENEACCDLQQMEARGNYLVWCYGLKHLFDALDPLQERLVEQRVSGIPPFPPFSPGG